MRSGVAENDVTPSHASLASLASEYLGLAGVPGAHLVFDERRLKARPLTSPAQ
jgi:hypothetical protein